MIVMITIRTNNSAIYHDDDSCLLVCSDFVFFWLFVVCFLRLLVFFLLLCFIFFSAWVSAQQSALLALCQVPRRNEYEGAVRSSSACSALHHGAERRKEVLSPAVALACSLDLRARRPSFTIPGNSGILVCRNLNIAIITPPQDRLKTGGGGQ